VVLKTRDTVVNSLIMESKSFATLKQSG